MCRRPVRRSGCAIVARWPQNVEFLPSFRSHATFFGYRRRTSSARLETPWDRRSSGAPGDPSDAGLSAIDSSLALGFTRNEIDHRARTTGLIRLHRGVYAVGHEALNDRGRMIAGLLAAGPGAVLSHRTAAALWKLIPSLPPFVEVTLTDRRPRQPRRPQDPPREAARDHAPRRPPGHHAARTLKDFPDPRAWSEALYLGLIDRADAPPGAEPTRSELERKLLTALAAAGLPRPLVNHPIGRYRVDYFWPEHKLVVETDGWAGHGHRIAFERDRARDAVAAGRAVQGAPLHLAPGAGRDAARDGADRATARPDPPPRARDPPGRGVGHSFFPDSARGTARVSA